MHSAPITALLPLLHRSAEARFNVFDVMHHGTHEKQLSNAFAWLLDPSSTHGFGETFQRIFIGAISYALADAASSVDPGAYLVRQEVNTAEHGELMDVADIVLESVDHVIVVENYHTSDGHGHDYDRYLRYARRDGRLGTVVLLCQEDVEAARTDGWDHAAVVTYEAVLSELHETLRADQSYKNEHGDAWSFVHQMYRKFAMRRSALEDAEILHFVTAMCDTGEAARYGQLPYEMATSVFAEEVARQAARQFDEGREALQRVKGQVVAFCRGPLRDQWQLANGPASFGDVSANYKGIYQWTINLIVATGDDLPAERNMQIKFGPSAWTANENDTSWESWDTRFNQIAPDYSHLFVTNLATHTIKQSTVTLADALAGMPATDQRLCEELQDLWGAVAR